MTTDLEKLVHENLDNALENGYDLTGWLPREIAEDITECCADLEDRKHDDLIPHIESWLDKHRKGDER